MGTIKQVIVEKKRAGVQIESDNTKVIYEIGHDPRIKSSMMQDPVMRVIVNALRHRNEAIDKYGELLHYYCVMWQNENWISQNSCSVANARRF